MAQLVALLRGINLGRSRRLPMADLRAALGDLGYGDVRTLLQSGNVVLDADAKPEAVADAISARIAERFELDVDVIVRTADELAAVLAEDPFDGEADDGAKRVVVFLGQAPDRKALADLAERDFAPERFHVSGREVHAWCPGGLQKSPVLDALGKGLVRSTGTYTVRNWNTLGKLAAMTGDAD